MLIFSKGGVPVVCRALSFVTCLFVNYFDVRLDWAGITLATFVKQRGLGN